MNHDDRQFIQQLFEAQTQQFQRHLSAVAENFDHKIGLIAEGHESLNQKIDDLAMKTEKRFDLVGFKIDTVAKNLKEHRADTEAHHGVYRVKEGGDDWNR